MSTKTGRPTKETPTVVTKLVAAFNIGYNDTEACFYAGISRNTYYQWLNDQVEFRDKIEQAKCGLNMKAKGVVVDALGRGDLNTAKWWLKHRAQKEFGKAKEGADELPKDYKEIQKLNQNSLTSLEKLICMRYRGILFLQLEQQQSNRLLKKPNDKTRIDELLALPNHKLTDHIQLEIYATGNDKAGVKELLEQRRSLQTDIRRIPTEIRVV
ncbi:hypothetical protein BH23PAT2_BH23PAT2_03050 [soil metagenome]